MRASVARAIAIAAGAGTVAGIAYTAIAIARVRRFRRAASQPVAPSSTPPVTILKPLCGDEPELRENLRSFCELEYPQYQVIFGTADPADPALDVARALAEEYLECDIEVTAGNAQAVANPKVGNLLGMIGRARYPLIVIADSDIHAGKTYLRAVAACFDDPNVGAATCAYGGCGSGSLFSQLGAMQVNDHFTPSVMVATLIEPLTYCFGATMAVRSEVLERIGGLRALADHLGDDYVLGKLVTDAGHRVELAARAVQTTVADDTLQALWRREVRWARTVFAQRPAGYAGSVVTYVLPFAVMFALAARTPFSKIALAVAAVLRTWLHCEARQAFAPDEPLTPWLIPARDLLSAAVWFAGLLGRQVHWKRDSYRLDASGRMAMGPKEL